MKNTQLTLSDYLKRVQYFVDEGFTLEGMDDEKTLTIGIYVKEADERFWFGLSELKEFSEKYGIIDVNLYRGEVKVMAGFFNKLIDETLPLSFSKKKIRKKLRGMDEKES